MPDVAPQTSAGLGVAPSWHLICWKEKTALGRSRSQAREGLPTSSLDWMTEGKPRGKEMAPASIIMQESNHRTLWWGCEMVTVLT